MIKFTRTFGNRVFHTSTQKPSAVKNDRRVLRRLCFFKKVVRNFSRVSFATVNAVTQQLIKFLPRTRS